MLKLAKLTIQKALDNLFPKRPDAAIVDSIEPALFLTKYRPQKVGEVVFLLPFQDNEVRACIHELKYHQNPRALDLLSAVLEKYLHTHSQETLLAPIPLSRQRLKERGYNQAQLLAKKTSAEVAPNLLQRIRDTKPQTSLSKNDRIQNMKDAFTATETGLESLADKNIIILDDVVTTGATLWAAKAALLPPAPHTITLLAIAH